MTKKLFVVTVLYEALVLADDELAAEYCKDEIQKWDQSDVRVEPFTGAVPWGYDKDTLVYTDDSEDVTVEQAIAIHEQALQPDLPQSLPQPDTRT